MADTCGYCNQAAHRANPPFDMTWVTAAGAYCPDASAKASSGPGNGASPAYNNGTAVGQRPTHQVFTAYAP